MAKIVLVGSTGAPQADQILSDAVGLIEARWPERVRGYYLVGSYAIGESRPSSDIDLIVLFKHELEPASVSASRLCARSAGCGAQSHST